MTSATDLGHKCAKLLARIGSYPSCAVAFSGGVDSAVVAKAAALVLGSRAVAVTADSPSLAAGELEQAAELARLIGIRHVVLQTHELSSPEYVRNAADRCYHCKSELYTQLDSLCAQLDVAVVLNGANRDDLADYRPGLQAAAEHAVVSPLADCNIGKQEVRQLAAQWDLPVWDKPAMPCLSSRIAYGEAVTPERLRMIDQAEQFLRHCGFREVRVRFHRGDLARIEVGSDQLHRFLDAAFSSALAGKFQELGFRYVTLDLQGFRSGSLNAVLPLETLRGS
jgi:uncharacterized protein